MAHAHEAPGADRVDEANDASLRSVCYRGSVEDCLARVERALSEAGLRIFARVDHAAEARAVGLAMRPTVLVLFGSPKVGTPLMIAKPTAAIDLPLKALVWQSEAGETWLTYNTPALLEQRHGLDPALASSLGPAGDLLESAMRR